MSRLYLAQFDHNTDLQSSRGIGRDALGIRSGGRKRRLAQLFKHCGGLAVATYAQRDEHISKLHLQTAYTGQCDYPVPRRQPVSAL